MISRPLLLVGAERSGTTLLRLMLSHHPQIAFHSEFEEAVDMMPEQDGWPDVRSYHDWLATNRVFQHSKLAIDPNLSYPNLIDSFLLQVQERSGKPLIGATVHRHWNRLLRIWPDARFIHLIRDGRDVARSTIQMGWAGNIWTGVERWIEAEDLWLQTCARVPEQDRIDVRYEDLIVEPEANLRRLCSFIGAPFDGAMLEFHKNSTYDAPDPKLIYQWKRKLSDAEVQLAEARIGEMLLERGYELSGLSRLAVDSEKQRTLLRQDVEYRRKFRINRYGLGLVLASYIARTLGAESLSRTFQLRMNAIDNQRIK